MTPLKSIYWTKIANFSMMKPYFGSATVFEDKKGYLEMAMFA